MNINCEKVNTNFRYEITGDRQHILLHQNSKFTSPPPRFMKCGEVVTSLHRINDKECGYGKTSQIHRN